MRKINSIILVLMIILVSFSSLSAMTEGYIYYNPPYPDFGTNVESGEEFLFSDWLGSAVITVDYPEAVGPGELFDITITLEAETYWTYYTTYLWAEDGTEFSDWDMFRSYYLHGDPDMYTEKTATGVFTPFDPKLFYPRNVSLMNDESYHGGELGQFYWVPFQIEQMGSGYAGMIAYESGVDIITLTNVTIQEDKRLNLFFYHYFYGQPLSVSFEVSVVEPIEVTIDIKPGSDTNSINLGSNGNIPVAILSTADFSAATVDPATVTLAGASVGLKGKSDKLQASYDDVNNDGLTDLVLHISFEGLELEQGSTYATLEGSTYEGDMITGTDSVNIVPA